MQLFYTNKPIVQQNKYKSMLICDSHVRAEFYKDHYLNTYC